MPHQYVCYLLSPSITVSWDLYFSDFVHLVEGDFNVTFKLIDYIQSSLHWFLSL
uniref:Uncharacterized protein n=1 Tax=Octopus bimaculoides TaxID=37653 RepID=A0A0L8FIZ3_OCTBM